MSRLFPYVRCAKCHRLLQRSTSTQVDGLHYGPECLQKVLQALRDQDSPNTLRPKRVDE